MARVKVGVVGLGNQGLAHVEALKSLHTAELIAVVDVNAERARKVAAEYKIPKAYFSVDELCEDADVEAVIIATPDHLHLEPVTKALKAGKHVLVEKPMATRVEDAELMAAEARRRGLFLMVDFENRFNPPFAYIKELLEAGRLGEPLYAYIRLSDTIYVPKRMLSWASKTTVAFFLMSHTADLARWYFSKRVVEVYAASVEKVLADMGTPDAFGAVLKFEGGGFALLESGWVLPEAAPSVFDFKLELVCTKGAVRVNTEKESMEVINGGFQYPHLAKSYRLHGAVTGFLREVDRHFIDCIAGRAEPLVKPEDGVENVRIIEAVVRSSREGRPVKL